MKSAFITGAGQDSKYLSEYLLSLGYDVHVMIRRNSITEHQQTRLEGLDVKTYYGDLSDVSTLHKLLNQIKPDEIYNLAAQSHVRVSFDVPEYTVQTNALGVMNMLEAYRVSWPHAKFYQASSSEMFGNSVDPDGYQRETTPMHPVSPYGCAKLFGYHITKTYRDSYNLHASNGILFNHESPYRASNFVTMKVIKGAIAIANKKADTLELGNLDSFRDWGHSKDYVRAMHLIMQQEPGDWVVSTEQTHSVRELCEFVFEYFGLDYQKYVVQNPQYLRPNELQYLKGDSSRIRALGWKPEYDFKTMIKEMIESCLPGTTITPVIDNRGLSGLLNIHDK
jgi:GDPmannose 4,6-dehydratase